MLGTATNPVKRIVYRGLLSSRAVVLALLGALIFAAAAHAEAPPTGAADGSAVFEAPASGEAPSPEGAEGGSGSGEGPKSTPEVPVEEAVVPVEPPPVESVVPVEPPPIESVVPVEPPPVEAVVPVEPPPVEAVVPTEIAPTVPIETTGEKAEIATPLTGAEESGKGSVEVSAQAGDTHSASVAVASEEAAITPAPGASAVSVHSAAEQAGSAAEILSLGVAVRKTASQLSGQLSCELSALSGRSAGGCGAGLFGAQSLLLASPATLSGVSASLDPAATGVVPERGSHGSSTAMGGAPAGPAPGSSTGGSSGAAVGASGPAPSAFLSLACLLLLGAPRAMRRLRLSSRPLLTASFVLIPERPG